jgi:cyclophilin family peptidyl-prolyl cis-trans isomerase
MRRSNFSSYGELFMRKSLSLLGCVLMLVALVACAPTVPATVPFSSGLVNQNSTAIPTQNTSSSQVTLPTATQDPALITAVPTQDSAAAESATEDAEATEGVVSSADAQTPTQICQSHVPAPTPSNRTFSTPEQVLQPNTDYRAVFCTGTGAVYVDLFEELTPVTVNNFVFLSQQGYYNNTMFHRVIQDFMAQGGDPEGTGMGGPGYQFQEEIVPFLHYDRAGWLAMARTSQPGTNGSQFFITTTATPNLNFENDGIGYTIFGEVLEGQANVNSIRLRDPQTDPNPGTSLDTIVIITDPATVTTSYVAPSPATSDQVIAGLRGLSTDPQVIQASLTLDVSGALLASDVQTSAPEAIREGYGTFFETHHHEYRVTSILSNQTCNTQEVGFMTMSYTVDAYLTVEDAEAAFNDPFLSTVPAALGLPNSSISSSLTNPYYSGTTTACNTTADTGLTFYHYGRYVITAQATVPQGGQATPDVWIAQWMNFFFGRGLSDVFRAGLR